MNAHIFQINISPGGVPKLPVFTAEVGELGIFGDDQRNKKHHGGPDRALCIYALERTLALQKEGHPIFPGSIGENVVTAGLDLGSIGPGSRLRMGEVELEITSYVVPCKTISRSFIGGDFSRILETKHPGWSRLYARVLRGGRMGVGDTVTILE